MKSVLERVAELPALVKFSRSGSKPAAGPSVEGSSGEGKVCLQGSAHGLIGASRSAAIGALARARQRHSRVVLAVVDGPDSAMDVVSDLRAFLRVEQTEQRSSSSHPPSPTSATADKAASSQQPVAAGSERGSISKRVERASSQEAWPDYMQAPSASLPDELKTGLPLETSIFPAWDVLPT